MITDPVPFLANIIAVAHADGQLSAGEKAQLEAVRLEFNFKKGDFSKALKLVEQGCHQLIPVGSFADQVVNLECILRVAYADNELEQAETDLITGFCEKIGIYQDQVDRLAGQVLEGLSQHAKACPSCATTASCEAQFCATCGTPLSQPKESVQLDFEIPSIGLAIEFPDSTSASFSKALELAKTSNGYQSCQRLKKSWHLAIYKSGSVSEALPLAVALSGMRNRRAFLNGTEVSWDELFGFTWCASQRASAYRPAEYCFGKDENKINCWGCKQANLDWVEWGDWFSYGRWEKGGLLGPKHVWRFDKDRIRHELATRIYRFRYCPSLNLKLFEAALGHLPDAVCPEKDENWKYHQSYEQLPGAIQVKTKEKMDDFIYEQEFWSDGVRPVGQRALADILNAAFKEVGVTQTSAQLLLK